MEQKAKQKMEQTKHKSLPFEKTIDAKKIFGVKVITDKGKIIGKIKSIHLHPTDLTVEGIYVDTGMFDVDRYIDENYIKSIGDQGVMLKTTPVSEFIGLKVIDSLGKKVGKVKEINRFKKTNTILSMKVKLENGEDMLFTADYVAIIGESVILKEPYKF